MDTPTMLERREVHMTEITINQYVTLVQMPDLHTFDLHVEGDRHYVVHFLNPEYFGKEFATIGEGYNLFTRSKGNETECYLFDDTQLRDMVAGVESPQVGRIVAEAQPPSGRAFPCTGPIIIPPRHSNA